MSEPIVRPAESGDLVALAAVAAAAGSPDAATAAAGLAQCELVLAEGRLLGLWSGARAVGMVGVLVREGATFVSDLFVDPAAHGQGFGGLLLAAALDRPRTWPTAVVTFSSQHPAARTLYERHGLFVRGRVLYLSCGDVVRHVYDGSPLATRLRDEGWSELDHDLVMATPGWEWPVDRDEVSPGSF